MIQQPDIHPRPQIVWRLRFAVPRVPNSWKAIRRQIVTLAFVSLVVFPAASHAVDLPICPLPADAVSISQPGATQGATDLHLETSVAEANSVDGVIRLDLRNDGLASVTEVCVSPHFSDSDGASHDVSVALSGSKPDVSSLTFDKTRACLKLDSPWPGYQSTSFDVHIRTSSASIPLSGFVLIDAAGQGSEPQPQSATTTRPALTQGTGALAGTQPTPKGCVSHAKPLARSFNLLPSKDPFDLYLPLYGGLIVGFIYLVVAFMYSGKEGWLGKPMGGPQWSFGTSFATNFTVGTGLLSLVLGGSLITDALHYMTKTHYVVLSLFFAAILLIAPALFTFFSTPHRFPSKESPVVVAPAAPVWFFLFTSALMVGAVVGQLFTVGLAMDEVRYRGYLSYGTFSMFAILLGGAGIGALAAALGVVPAYFNQKNMPEPKQLVEKLSSLKRRATSMRGYVPETVPKQQPLNDEDIILLDHLIAREQVPAKWTMF